MEGEDRATCGDVSNADILGRPGLLALRKATTQSEILAS
jgi:hypothetical protein